MRLNLLLLCCCMALCGYGIAQPNNNCSNAIPITQLNGTCLTGNDNTGATEDIGQSSCTAGSNNNVWFSFTAQGYSAEVIVTSAIGTPEITIVGFTGAACVGANAQEIECAVGNSVIVDGDLTIGVTYYIMVAFTNNGSGLFDICVNNPVPAPNDNCINAIPIANLNDNCFTTNNNFPSTDLLVPGCFTGTTYNVWYSFVAQGVSLDLYIPAGGPGVSQLAVIQFPTPCSAGGVSLGCATGTNHIVLDNVLTIGQTYYVVVGFQNINFSGSGVGNFELCIDNPVPAPNDDCMSAIVIPPSVLSDPTTCFTTIAGNPLNNDFPSTDVGTAGCWDSNASYNIWYSFVAQGPDVQIEVDPVFNADAQIALVQFTGPPCSAANSLLGCANGMVLDFNDGLIAGNTYYIAVGFENNAVGNFCMNVFNPIPPPNDSPCSPVALLTNNNCTNGTTVYANPEGWNVPGPCTPSTANTVWYTLSLADPDNVGFEIDVNFNTTPPGMQVSIILWQLTNCNTPGSIAFFHCGAPPTNTLEWGPIDETATYYLSISTTEQYETGFQICVDEIPPCFTNDGCPTATVINGVVSDQAFVCIPGCNLFADPETVGNPCGIQNFSTVWFQVNSDPQASLLNIQVNSQDFLAPTISVFLSLGGCSNLQPIGLTNSNLPCVVGSGGEATAFGTPIGANQIYYIAISSLNSVGGEFTVCVNTISQASACVVNSNVQITSRSAGGPLTGPFFPGETIGVCMNVVSYTSSGNNCQWFQGLVPIFGNGWDPSSFDGDGMPLNATLNGDAFNPIADGIYGASMWGWFSSPAEVGYHHPSPFFYIGDLDGNGSLDMCSILYDPDCPTGGLTGGGGPGPCWNPLGDQLPPGWFAWGINGLCPIPGYPGVDYGDGGCCSCIMGPWNFCFELTIRDYPDCLQDPTTIDLSLGFFTFADGEVGSWNGGPSICALDQPVSVTYPMCCSEIDDDFETLDPICSGQQFIYTIDEPGVEFWQWTVQSGTVTGALPGQGGPGTTMIHTLINNGSSSGSVTYTFLGFAGGACPVFNKEVTIEVFPPIQVSFDPVLFCSTPSTPYPLSPNVEGGSGNYFYQWGPPGSEVTSSILISNPVNGATYTVTVTDDIGCSNTGQISISVYANFPVDIVNSAVAQCLQDGPIDMFANVSGGIPGYTYEWTFPSSTTSSGQTIFTTETGQHVLVVTDSEGCTGKDSVSVTFHETPEVEVFAVNGAEAICEGESTELSAVPSMGTGPYIYEWNTPDGFEVGKNIIAFTPGLYTVTVEDANGCTNEFSIEIEAQPQPYPDLGPDIFICNTENDTELSVSGGFYSYYRWSTDEHGPNQTSITVYDPGLYSVTVTNEFGCQGNTSVQVVLHEQPVFPMDDEFPVCPGLCITIDLDDYNGPWDNYNWAQFPLAFNDATICTPGTYQVTVYDDNLCPATHEFTIVETSSVVTGLQGDNVICSGETITLAASAGFASYQWSPNTGAGNTSTADVTSPGTYILTVYDDEGCYGIDSIVVVSGDITASISGPVSICANVLATIDAGAGYASYLWSNDEVTRTIQVPAGTYSVTVTSVNGCTASAQTTIVEQPFTPVITGDNMICTTSETTTLDASSGGPHTSYLWSANAGNATTPSVIVSQPGTYTVTVVDISGCVGNAAFTVSNHPVPFVAVTGSPDFCVGGTTQLDATAGYAGYEWSNSEPTPFIVTNIAGVYSVTVTDNNGCTNTASMTVNPPFQETVTITGSFVFCPGDFATLAVPAGYASVQWSTGDTDDQITVSFEGDVSVVVIDAEGCVAYDTVTTQANAELNPTITGNAAICDNGTTVLNAGPGFDNYQWSHSLGTTQTVTVNAPGTYSVTVSSNSGCVGDDDFTVVQYISPFAVVTSNATVCDIQEPGGPPTSVNFNSLVTGGDTGGTWVQTSGPSTVNLSNPANVNFNGLNQGAYTFSYTTNSATAPCVEQTYPLTVDVVSCACPEVLLFDAPDLCNSFGIVCLNTLLLPQTPQGGVWSLVSTPPGGNPGFINASGCFEAASADAGAYVLRYQVSGLPSYCTDNASVTVNVMRNPVAGTAAPTPQYCMGENVTVALSTLILGGDNGGMWIETSQFPSTGNAFDQINGRFTVTQQVPGTYTFDYVLTGPGPCPDDVTTVEIVIEANPVADAGAVQTLDCLTTSVSIGGNGTSTGSAFTYQWTTTDGSIVDPTLSQATVTAPGTYVLTVRNTLTGCTASDEVVVEKIGEFPTDFNLIVQSPDCAGDPPGSAVVTSVIGGTQPYRYSLNNAPAVSSGTFNNLPPGDYTLEVVDATGCSVSKDFTIDALVEVDLSIINFQNELVFDLGQTVTFGYSYSGSSSVPDSLVWKTKDSVICINCPEIVFDAYLGGTIILEAYDIRGCFISQTVTYQVIRKRDVYIPNIFSPNGDNINDEFTLFTSSDVKEIEVMEIYSRWGELLYRNTKFQANDVTEGWDGRFRGERVNPGVYVYLFEVVYGDDVKISFTGDVTVVK